jgi:methyl-accepting chemotaxis protein
VVVVLALLSGLWMQRARRTESAQDEYRVDVAGVPPEVMRQVVPVWGRSLDAAREHSERNTQDLLERFASISVSLDAALGDVQASGILDSGATETLIERHRPELDRLLSATRAVVKLKDDFAQALGHINDSLQEMVSLSQQVQLIGRATHMLALNASVEANRAGASGTGFAVVAQEVRELATQSRQAATRMTRLVDAMRQQMREIGQQADQQHTDEEDLVMQAEESARDVVTALLASLVESSRSSRQLREASRQVHKDIERVLMDLQGQDRLSQMVGCVIDDMTRLVECLSGRDDPAAKDARHWLERLESSYTMEEQRNTHHETVTVDRQPAVEFF